MMSIVGTDFNGQAAAAAAAAAAALGVQQPTLLTANSNDIYGLAQMSGLHQQLLQQSAAAVFQNYTEIMDEDANAESAANASAATSLQTIVGPDGTQYVVSSVGNEDAAHQIYQAQLDDAYNEDSGGDILTPKQEIINIDDFVMMNDSNSYDDAEFMQSSEKDGAGSVNAANEQQYGMDDNALLVPLTAGVSLPQKLSATVRVATASGSSNSASRSQRKTRKIEPVNRPGLVLKTPIAYKGNIDPSVIPIQKDGMGMFCCLFVFILRMFVF